MDRPWRGPGKRLRVRVGPTVRGWQVLVVGAASLVVALSLGTTQLYQLAYALLGLLVAALALGLAGSRSLGLERRMPRGEGITAGVSTTIGLRLTNGSRLAASGVEVVDHLPKRNVSRPPAVPAGGEHLVESTVSFARRGLYGIGPAGVASTDPFGLLRFRRDIGLEAEVLVYPEVQRITGLPVRGSEEAGGRIHPRGRGEELSGLREYRPGDDRRFIHWKSVARTGELVVKEFDPDVPRRYSVVLDLDGSGGGFRAGGHELEDAVSAAASAVSHLDGAGLTYRLRLADRAASSTGFGVGSRAGNGSYHAAMRLLATAMADGETGTAEALRKDASEGSLGESVILIQREATESTEPTASTKAARQGGLADAVREISSRGVSVVVLLLASHTYAPGRPQGGGHVQAREPGQEARLSELVRGLEGSGAAVRVLRRETGVAGLSAAAGRRFGSREAV